MRNIPGRLKSTRIRHFGQLIQAAARCQCGLRWPLLPVQGRWWFDCNRSKQTAGRDLESPVRSTALRDGAGRPVFEFPDNNERQTDRRHGMPTG